MSRMYFSSCKSRIESYNAELEMSSSSSDSDCDNYWKYESGYNRPKRNPFGRNPFYPTMGHPLIYYAQVPQPICMKQRSRERRRDNPNCFVKAFRWYTQEHVPNRSVSPTTKPDMVGFAIWLDTKYDQFLQECHINSDTYRGKAKHTSVIQTNKIYNNDFCEPCATRRFRVKSPWKKRRLTKSDETRDERQKSNHSFQYIMQPKDTSRPVSECCQLSNSRVVQEMLKKAVTKSRSYSNITIVTSKEHTEIKPSKEDSPIQKSVCDNMICQNAETIVKEAEAPVNKTEGQDFCCQFSEIKGMRNAETHNEVKEVATNASVSTHQPEVNSECGNQELDKKPIKPSHNEKATISPKTYANVDCQCPEEKVVQAHVQTQYEIHEKCPSTAFHDAFLRNNPPMQSPVPTSNINNQCPCGKMVGELQPKPAVAVRFSENTAQTSNHSIRFEKETVLEYPLFMKVVCADKLSEDNMK